MAKRLVGAAGVRSPEGTKIEPWEDAEAVLSEFGRRAPCPWFIKPAFEGSSKGARSSGLVDDEARAVAVARRLAADYGQTILVEQFIDGDEVTVGLIGNPPAVECLGVTRIIPKNREGRFVYSVEVKRDYLNQVAYETPARLPETTMSAVIDSARRAYEALGCRDLARIDFRIGGGVPFFIEANPLPGLAPVSSDLVIMAEGLGISHADLIRRILRTALSRVGLWKGGPR